MRLFDTHAHLLDRKFDVDRQILINTLPESGIVGVIECGTNVTESKRAAALTESADYLYAAAGVHPHDSNEAQNDFIIQIEALARKPKVIAIGEIGLDYHYDFSPKETQRKVFGQQLDLAKRLGMPVAIHMREATQDMLAILEEHKGVKGVVHCFSGSAETAEIMTGMGLHISFTGSVTFDNARKVVDAAAAVPIEKLMAETDCPYLSPEPVRGTRNNPVNVKFVLQKLAQLKGVSFEDMCEANINNAKRLYNI